MAKTAPFDQYTDEYDAWFDLHDAEYALELRALRELMPEKGQGLEIGVGTGKFAGPLGISHGVDPSEEAIRRSKDLGIVVTEGVAEQLPYRDESFDYALMVTTICFVDDLGQSFKEAARILRPGGKLLIGFVDRESPLGQKYLARRRKSHFYAIAHFFSTDEVLEHLGDTGFYDIRIRQTILPDTSGPEIIDGYGRGSFVAISAIKKA